MYEKCYVWAAYSETGRAEYSQASSPPNYIYACVYSYVQYIFVNFTYYDVFINERVNIILYGKILSIYLLYRFALFIPKL